MNKHFRKVLSVLKTKVKALGFSRSELKGVAASIADNLDLKDDASDEEIDSAIDDAVEDAMPFLKISQSAAQRAIQNFKDAHNVKDDDDDDDDDKVRSQLPAKVRVRQQIPRVMKPSTRTIPSTSCLKA